MHVATNEKFSLYPLNHSSVDMLIPSVRKRNSAPQVLLFVYSAAPQNMRSRYVCVLRLLCHFRNCPATCFRGRRQVRDRCAHSSIRKVVKRTSCVEQEEKMRCNNLLRNRDLTLIHWWPQSYAFSRVFGVSLIHLYWPGVAMNVRRTIHSSRAKFNEIN